MQIRLSGPFLPRSNRVASEKISKTVDAVSSVLSSEFDWHDTDGMALDLDDVSDIEQKLQLAVLSDDTGATRPEFGFHLRLFGSGKNDAAAEVKIIFHIQDSSNPQEETVSVDLARFQGCKYGDDTSIRLCGELIDLWDPTALDMLSFDWSYDRMDGDILEIPSGQYAYSKEPCQSDSSAVEAFASRIEKGWLFSEEKEGNAPDSFKSFCNELRLTKRKTIEIRVAKIKADAV